MSSSSAADASGATQHASLSVESPLTYAEGLDVSDSSPTELMDLNDDSLTHILKCSADVSGIAAAAACCKHFSKLAASDAVWKHAVECRWPLLPPSSAESTGSWREFHRQRSTMPSWRYFIVRMDEVEHLLRQLAHGADDPERKLCDRLAAVLLAVFCSAERCEFMFAQNFPAPGAPGFDGWLAWTRRVAELLREPRVCAAVREWTTVVTASLDEFYERAFSRSEHRAKLLRAMRCASALRLFEDELILTAAIVAGSSDGVSLASKASADEKVATFKSAVASQRVEESLQSLEMEGFDVSVPPAYRPARLPTHHAGRLGHFWWFAHAPVHYAERC